MGYSNLGWEQNLMLMLILAVSAYLGISFFAVLVICRAIAIADRRTVNRIILSHYSLEDLTAGEKSAAQILVAEHPDFLTTVNYWNWEYPIDDLVASIASKVHRQIKAVE